MSPSLAPMRRANASINPRRFMPLRLARSSATTTTLRAVESTTRESTREDDEDDTARDDDRASSSTSSDDRLDAFSSLERALADRVHHLAAALERERAERAQWARARIELLSQFCAAGDGAPPVQGLLRAAEASPPPPVPPPPPPALE